MSVYECLEIYAQLDLGRYLRLLRTAYGARPHPHQPGSYLIGEPSLPFYRPQQYADHVAILSFNYAPLSSLLILALGRHPDLASPDTVIHWTAEQELLVRGRLGLLAGHLETQGPGHAAGWRR